MADWKDILSHDDEQLSEEELLKYLDKSTPADEKLAIEKKAANTPFEKDALEGLQQIKTDRVKKDVKLLNQKLQQQLLSKKQRQDKGKIRDLQWIILAILILLFISVFGYVIIRMANNENETKQHSLLIKTGHLLDESTITEGMNVRRENC